MSSRFFTVPTQTLKWSLAAGTLAFVGAYFYHLLGQLEETPIVARPWLLVAAAAIYIAGQFSSIACWRYLLGRLGHQPPESAIRTAFFWGQFGKYIPGRVWALFYRASLLRRGGVPFRDGFFSAFLEGLLQALAGAVLGMVLCLFVEISSVPRIWIVLALAILAAVVATLIGLVRRQFAREAKGEQDSRTRQLSVGVLCRATAIVTPIWILHGFALWLLLSSFLPDSNGLDPGSVVRTISAYVLSFSAGFAIVFIPNGLGVRELVMQQLLAAELSRAGVENALALAAVITVVARLAFLASEAIAAIVASVLPANAPLPAIATKTPAGLPQS